MTYAIVSPPFSLRFEEMSVRELKAYNTWFHDALPDRIGALSSYVRETGGSSGWRADRKPDSLLQLGRWLQNNVVVRPLSSAERERQQSRGLTKFGLPEWELSDETISLAFDVGAYFGEVLVNTVPGTAWTQVLSGVRRSDIYGQPSVRGANGRVVNPIRLALTLCYGIARGTKTGERLPELYAIWSKELTSA